MADNWRTGADNWWTGAGKWRTSGHLADTFTFGPISNWFGVWGKLWLGMNFLIKVPFLAVLFPGEVWGKRLWWLFSMGFTWGCDLVVFLCCNIIKKRLLQDNNYWVVHLRKPSLKSRLLGSCKPSIRHIIIRRVAMITAKGSLDLFTSVILYHHLNKKYKDIIQSYRTERKIWWFEKLL